MPTPRRPKPPLSAWIIRERKRLGLKPVDLAQRLTAMGLPTADGTPRTWEAGRPPAAENIEGLERIFGTRAPETAGTMGDTHVPAVLLDAISELVEALRSSRLERDAIEARLRALEAAATLRGGSGGGAPQAQDAPQRSA